MATHPAAYIRVTGEHDPARYLAMVNAAAACLAWPEPVIYADVGPAAPPDLVQTITKGTDLATPAGRLLAGIMHATSLYEVSHNAAERAHATGRPSADPGTAGEALLALAAAIAQDHHDALLITSANQISRRPADAAAFTAFCQAHNVTVYLPNGEQVTTLHITLTDDTP
jgi:hypothetical protein